MVIEGLVVMRSCRPGQQGNGGKKKPIKGSAAILCYSRHKARDFYVPSGRQAPGTQQEAVHSYKLALYTTSSTRLASLSQQSRTQGTAAHAPALCGLYSAHLWEGAIVALLAHRDQVVGIHTLQWRHGVAWPLALHRGGIVLRVCKPSNHLPHCHSISICSAISSPPTFMNCDISSTQAVVASAVAFPASHPGHLAAKGAGAAGRVGCCALRGPGTKQVA